MDVLSLVHMNPVTFCGGKELRCNFMFWLKGGKRLLITGSYFLLLSSLSHFSLKLHTPFLFTKFYQKLKASGYFHSILPKSEFCMNRSVRATLG